MKKIIFSLFAMVVCLSSVAQKDVKVRFGVEAGFNMTKWNGALVPNYAHEMDQIVSDFSSSGMKPGFHVGGLADLVIQDKWSIQPEFLFTMEGSKIAIDDSIGEKKVSAMYLRIPILVYYNIMNVGPGQLSPGLGFFFAGGVGGKVEDGGDTFGDDGVLDEFDWGLNVKVAYELQKVASGVFVSAGFSQGFSTSKSTGISISAGYKFQYAKFLKRKYNTGLLEYNP